jgi:diketogulonate reductase-like aldo/keto reductase
MEQRQFGPTNREVAIIGQGTWYIDGTNPSVAMDALRTGLDKDMCHIDTAEIYGDAEEIIGQAIAGRRDEVFLVSKVLPSNASRQGTILACERSLARLRTDRLDCYLLHWRGSYPLEETVAAFEQLMQEGKILSWGVSNFDIADLEEIWEITAKAGPVCNQVLYHLEERGIEHDILPWCKEHGIALTAYSPLGHGRFPDPDSPGGRVLQEIAANHNATPRQVALRFIVRQPTVFAIPKSSRPEHTAENAGAGELDLSDEELARIDDAFPRGPKPPSLPLL